MPFCQLNWFSNALSKAVTTNVLLPEKGDGPFPVFYLLHGLSDDYSIWMRRTRIEWYVKDLPLIVVMPDGGRGFYTDHRNNGPKWGTHIGIELPDFIEKHFNARKDPGGRAIGGLSMGGYGAIRIAMGNPGRFASVNCLSGCLTYGHTQYIANTPGRQAEFDSMAGENPTGGPFDLFALTENCKKLNRLPYLKLAHGTEDWLLPQAREYVQFLKDQNIPHEYDEFPGAHTWDFWDTHIQEALVFHAKNLGIA